MQHNPTEEAIRRELADYLTGKVSLRAFYDWFATETWDIHEWAPVQVQDKVSQIKLLIAEYSSGHRSEADLKARLRPFVTSMKVAAVPTSAVKVTGRVKLASKSKRKKVQTSSSIYSLHRKMMPPVKTASAKIGRAVVRFCSSGWAVFRGLPVAAASRDESVMAFG
jgi:hypothetical protein